jgi:hypothetical protein
MHLPTINSQVSFQVVQAFVKYDVQSCAAFVHRLRDVIEASRILQCTSTLVSSPTLRHSDYDAIPTKPLLVIKTLQDPRVYQSIITTFTRYTNKFYTRVSRSTLLRSTKLTLTSYPHPTNTTAQLPTSQPITTTQKCPPAHSTSSAQLACSASKLPSSPLAPSPPLPSA